MDQKYHTLVLGGGGAKGLAILGSLDFFYSLDLVDPQRISGTSIGSVIAVLLGLGMHPREIYEIAIEVEEPLRGAKNYAMVMAKYGVWSLTKSLAPFITRLLSYFDGKSPTLLEYYEATGIHLKVCASNVNRLEAVYFDHVSYPEVRVVDAIRASCCLPGIFKAVKILGEYYVDGGFVKNLPADAWGPEIPDEDLLILAVSGFPANEKINNAWSYFSRLAALFIMSHVRSAVKARPQSMIVEVVLKDIPLIPSFVSKKRKREVFAQGRAEAETRYSRKILTLKEVL